MFFKKIYPAYVSKHNLIREIQDILLIIPNGEGWHYISVKQLPVSLIGILSKRYGGFYYLNFLHSFRTKKS